MKIAGAVGCMLVAAACGDAAPWPGAAEGLSPGESWDSATDGPTTTGTGPSNTLPYFAQANWSPAGAPDQETEERINSSLYETGLVMILPAAPLETDDETAAEFSAEGTVSYPSGPMIWASAVLEISTDQGVIVTVDSPGRDTCPAGATVITFRGDPQACLSDDDSTVSWSESSQYLSAGFGPDFDIDAGLAWLETWLLQPPPPTQPVLRIEWTPAESPSDTELAALTALLDERGGPMVIPTSGPPTGTQADAVLDLSSFPGELVIRDLDGPLVTVTWAPNECLPDVPRITLRGDTDACASAQAGAYWSESGESFWASLPERADLPLDAALAWLETWELLPYSCEPGWADLDDDAANGCEYSWLDAYEPNDTPVSAYPLGTFTDGQTVTVTSTISASGGDPIDWFAINIDEGPQAGGDMTLSITAAPTSEGGELYLYDYTDGSLTEVGECVGITVYEGGCPIGWPMEQQVLFTWPDDPGSEDDKLLLIKVSTSAGLLYPEDYELTILFEE